MFVLLVGNKQFVGIKIDEVLPDFKKFFISFTYLVIRDFDGGMRNVKKEILISSSWEFSMPEIRLAEESSYFPSVYD